MLPKVCFNLLSIPYNSWNIINCNKLCECWLYLLICVTCLLNCFIRVDTLFPVIQVSELEAEFEKVKGEKVVPTRYLRSQQQKQAKMAAEAASSGERQGENITCDKWKGFSDLMIETTVSGKEVSKVMIFFKIALLSLVHLLKAVQAVVWVLICYLSWQRFSFEWNLFL